MNSYNIIRKLTEDANKREQLIDKWNREADQLGVYLNWLRLVKDIRQIKQEAERWLVQVASKEKERNAKLEEFLLQGTELPPINDNEQFPETD